MMTLIIASIWFIKPDSDKEGRISRECPITSDLYGSEWAQDICILWNNNMLNQSSPLEKRVHALICIIRVAGMFSHQIQSTKSCLLGTTDV